MVVGLVVKFKVLFVNIVGYGWVGVNCNVGNCVIVVSGGILDINVLLFIWMKWGCFYY